MNGPSAGNVRCAGHGPEKGERKNEACLQPNRTRLRTYLALLLCLVLPLFLMFGWIRIQYETYIQQQLSEQIISSISKSEEAVYDSFRNMAGISSAIVTNSALLEGLSNPANSYYSVNKLFDECVNYAQVNNLYSQGAAIPTGAGIFRITAISGRKAGSLRRRMARGIWSGTCFRPRF